MLRKILIFFLLPLTIASLFYSLTTLYLFSQIPSFSLKYLKEERKESYTQLPFFNLMTALPKKASYSIVPKLEYRPGPPKKFFYRLSYFYWKEKEEKEEIHYYGRKTQEHWFFPFIAFLTPYTSQNYSNFVLASLRYSHEQKQAQRSNEVAQERNTPLLARLLYLYQTKLFLEEFQKNKQEKHSIPQLYVMEQAGNPAFLLMQSSKRGEYTSSKALIKFYRRHSTYRVELYTGKEAFTILHPKKIFSQSFLVNSRKKALTHIGEKLSQVRIEQNKNPPSKKELEFPLLLLGSKLSLDPGSISALFHFTGINTLLWKHHRHTEDLEVLDSLRNNVLAARRYAKDISPKSPQTKEIKRLARSLQRL